MISSLSASAVTATATAAVAAVMMVMVRPQNYSKWSTSSERKADARIVSEFERDGTASSKGIQRHGIITDQWNK